MPFVDCVRSYITLIEHRKGLIAVIAISTLLLCRPLIVNEKSFLLKILLTEAVMFIGSLYVWVTLRYLLDSIPKDGCGCSVVCCIWFTKLSVALTLVLAHMSFALYYFLHGEDPPLLSFISFVCLGIFVQFVVCYFCMNTTYLVIDWTGNRFFGRRRIMRDISVHWMNFLVALLLSISMSVYGVYEGLQAPVLKTVEIPVKGLATSMDRLSVAAVADIHLGPTVGRTKLERVVQIVNNQEFGLYNSFTYYYLCQGGYVFVIVCLSVCLCVC